MGCGGGYGSEIDVGMLSADAAVGDGYLSR